MDDAALAALSDANYYDTFRSMTLAAGAPVREFGDLLCIATGTPLAFLNVAFVTRPLEAPEDQLRRAMSFFDDRRVPFVVRVREGVDAASEAAAERLGMPFSDTVPGMALFPLPQMPAPPAGLRIERIADEAGLAGFRELTSAGFSMPLEVSRRLLADRLLDLPGFEFYVGFVDGAAVTGSTLCRVGRTAGVYNVVTLHSHRRRGFGEAMTWHALRRGADAGCDVGILQASAMGRPVYERMGFRTVAPYRTFHRPKA